MSHRMTKTTLPVLTTLVFSGAAIAQSPATSPAAAGLEATNKHWVEATDPLHIVGPIYYVGTKGLGVYLFVTPAGHILLGGALPMSAPAIEASIRALGNKPEDIKLVVSNHAHADHAGTLAHFRKLAGARVVAMKADVEELASGGKVDYLFAQDPRFYYPEVTPDVVLKDGDPVELGGVRLTAHHTPGHTRGCTTFTTTVEDGGRSYAVVFADGTGVNPGTRFVAGPSYPGILEDYRRTLGVLEGLKPDVFLAYHTEVFDLAGKRQRAAAEGARAFVDPEGYARFVAGAKARIEDLVARERSAGAPARD